MDCFEWLDNLANYEVDRANLEFDQSGPDKVMGILGEPQRDYKIVHITGTNGKGSCAEMVSSMLSETGLHVGTYTSGDVGSLAERIKIDGEQITKGQLGLVLERLRSLVEGFDLPLPSFFEALTMTALIYFSDQGIDVGVIEVGMGGEGDATNVVEADVAVITQIDLDHEEQLGYSTSEIALKKRGIVKRNSDVILGAMSDDLATLIVENSAGRVFRYGKDFEVTYDKMAHRGRLIGLRMGEVVLDELFVPLHGRHQSHNAAVAVAAVEALFDQSIGVEIVQNGLSAIRLKGRVEVLSNEPLIIFDVAHNPSAASILATTLVEEFSSHPGWVVVVALTHGRDPDRFFKAMGSANIDRIIAIDLGLSFQVDPLDVAHSGSRLGVQSTLMDQFSNELLSLAQELRNDQLLLFVGTHHLYPVCTRLLGTR